MAERAVRPPGSPPTSLSSRRPRATPAGAAPPAPLSVFLTTTPLESGAARLLALAADAAATSNLPVVASLAAPHAVVILGRPAEPSFAFDFLPARPTAPLTVGALLARRPVPGVGRVRLLAAGPPRTRTVELGPVRCDECVDDDDPVAFASRVVGEWTGSELVVGERDCVSAAVGLASLLTGMEAAAVRAALASCASAPPRP